MADNARANLAAQRIQAVQRGTADRRAMGDDGVDAVRRRREVAAAAEVGPGGTVALYGPSPASYQVH